MILTICLSILAFFIFLVSFPIRIVAVHSPTVLIIRWTIIKVCLGLEESKTTKAYYLFGLKLKSQKEKASAKSKKTKKTNKPKKKGTKKKFRKISSGFIKEIFHHPLIRKILVKSINLLKRLYQAVKLRELSADIALDDYYWRGILHGLSYMINSDRILIHNNYQERNHMELDLKISIWRVLYALLIFLGSFPYLKTLRFYKHTLLEK